MKKGHSMPMAIGHYEPPKPTARQKQEDERHHAQSRIHERIAHKAQGTPFGTPPLEKNDMPYESKPGGGYDRQDVPPGPPTSANAQQTALEPASPVSSPMSGFKQP